MLETAFKNCCYRGARQRTQKSRGEKDKKKARAKEKGYGMQGIEVTGKQKGYTTFSARRFLIGICGLLSVGVKHAFSRKNSIIKGGVQ